MNVVKLLTFYVRPIRDSNQDFPEGFCDIVTASITKGYGHAIACCGVVEQTWHFWVKVGSDNIDFTAHQFPTLMRFVKEVDGFQVLVGSDEDLRRMGYDLRSRGYCEGQLKAVTDSDILGRVGECSTNLCLLN